MSAYLLINIAIIFFPLILSFEPKINFKKNILRVLKVSLILSIFFITWDISSTESGVWIFNPEKILGIKIIGLPIEEILFFFTVPYSMIFIYETINYYFKERKISVPKPLYIGISSVLIILSIFSYHYSYTFIVLSLTGVFLFVNTIYPSALLSSRNFIIFILFSSVPFVIFNYFLTSIPIITYDPESITGYRLLTMPVEDILYNFLMNSVVILIYKKLNGK